MGSPPCSGFTSQRNVSVHRSDDNGSSWRQIAWVQDQYWSNLFVLPPTTGETSTGGVVDVVDASSAGSGAGGSNSRAEERIYLLGTSSDGPSPIKLAMSRDAGATWDPSDSMVLFNGTNGTGYETGPTPSLIANGRVYRAMEHFRRPFVWGTDYEAVVLSASLTSDLLDPSSWRLSAPLPFNTSWIPPAMRAKMQAPGAHDVVIGTNQCCCYRCGCGCSSPVGVVEVIVVFIFHSCFLGFLVVLLFIYCVVRWK